MEATLYQALQAEFAKTPNDLAKIEELLQQAILQLTQSGILASPKETLSTEQLHLLCNVLEMGAHWSVQRRDGAAFERYLSQLTSIYDLPPTLLPPSPRMYALLGLRLLNLLVNNRRADFYTSLARLPTSTDPHLQFVVQLEQCLMEGTFHRLLLARAQVPAAEYAWFVDSLLETIRLNLADGIEKAYSQLDLQSAAAMLLLDKSQLFLLVEFAKKRGWSVQGELITFPNCRPPLHTALTQPDAKTLIGRALVYAHGLEQIV